MVNLSSSEIKGFDPESRLNPERSAPLRIAVARVRGANGNPIVEDGTEYTVGEYSLLSLGRAVS